MGVCAFLSDLGSQHKQFTDLELNILEWFLKLALEKKKARRIKAGIIAYKGFSLHQRALQSSDLHPTSCVCPLRFSADAQFFLCPIPLEPSQWAFTLVYTLVCSFTH